MKGADIFDLAEEEKFIGHRGEADNPSAVILKNNNLHIEILILSIISFLGGTILLKILVK